MTALLILAALGLAAPRSAPPPPPGPVVVAEPPPLPPTRVRAPAALPERAFAMPEVHSATLSNGIPVHVVENHEVPLAFVRVTFRGGGLADPDGKEGLARVTMDMLAKGAGDLDAMGMSAALKRLGSGLETSGGTDGASIAVSSLTRNLGRTLDLLASVWTEPTFPEAEWDLLRRQLLDEVKYRRSDPNAIGWHVLNGVVHGPTYLGRAMDEASLASIRVKDMRKWRKTWLVPAGASIFVGGDVTLAQVLPELEARFGGLGGKARALPEVVPPMPPPEPVLTLVDKPGAAQSVVLAARYAGRPADADYTAFVLANQAMGGMFTSRVNMNLREEKGYTYGARTSVSYNLGGTLWTASAPVKSAVTVEAVKELVAELSGPRGAEPLTDDELAVARGALVNAWPLRFEGPGYLLGQMESVWRYGLPEGWIDGFVDRVRKVDVATAQAAWNARVDPRTLRFVVVGDAASLRAPLSQLGMRLEERDVDGNLIEPQAP